MSGGGESNHVEIQVWVQGSGFRVRAYFRVQGLGFRVYSSGLKRGKGGYVSVIFEMEV